MKQTTQQNDLLIYIMSFASKSKNTNPLAKCVNVLQHTQTKWAIHIQVMLLRFIRAKHDRVKYRFCNLPNRI